MVLEHIAFQAGTAPSDSRFGPRKFVSAIEAKQSKKGDMPSREKHAIVRRPTAGAHRSVPVPAAKSTRGTETISIVVVDDHPLFRHGLVQLLNSEATFEVIGEASSAPDALTIVRRLKPSMVIVDLG